MKELLQTNLCIACGKDSLKNVINLGNQAPANNLLENKEDKDYKVYPLGLKGCLECGHGQLSYFVDPKELFSNYTYVSSTSETMKTHMAKLANFVLNLKGKEAAVLEIGSNDGLFLRSMTDIGLTNICGVDPAENIASKANEDGLTTVIGFWPEAGEEFSSLSFDVVIGQNVFAHTSDPLESLLEVKRVLSANGYAIFQTSQADMIANGELDTIYHEHCSFFVESSMSALAQRAGLQLAYTHYVDIHGASSLYILTHDYTEPDNLSIELSAIASGLIGVEPKNDKEARLRKYRTKKDWDTFHKIATIKSAGALTVAESWMEDGYRIVAVGAAAKAITFLRASGLPVDAFLDESDLKIGKWVPGLDVQITDFKSIEENDAYIIGAWNFAREIAMKLINQGADPAAPCMLYFPEGVTTNLGYLAVKGIDEL
jgi:SAM-dependent methyltransferase